MGNLEMRNMIDDYCRWLKSEITFAQYGEWCEITTPYLDRHNDYLQIYVRQENDGILTLTDDGCIIKDLLACGFNFSKKRKSRIENILNNFNMKLSGDSIVAEATSKDFPHKKHMLIQAMLKIDDMFVLSRPNIESFFFEDVENYFQKLELYPTKEFPMIGKSGNLYSYDFHFQRTKNKPERFCKTIDNLRKQIRDVTLYNWSDTREKRNDDSTLIVIVNDNNKIDESDITAFKNYEIETVLFSKRHEKEVIELFAS